MVGGANAPAGSVDGPEKNPCMSEAAHVATGAATGCVEAAVVEVPTECAAAACGDAVATEAAGPASAGDKSVGVNGVACRSAAGCDHTAGVDAEKALPKGDAQT